MRQKLENVVQCNSSDCTPKTKHHPIHTHTRARARTHARTHTHIYIYKISNYKTVVLNYTYG